MRYFEPDVLVYKMGSLSEEIYCIAEGTVLFMLDDTKKSYFLKMIKSAHFGEIEVFQEEPRQFSVRTESNWEILVVTQ